MHNSGMKKSDDWKKRKRCSIFRTNESLCVSCVLLRIAAVVGRGLNPKLRGRGRFMRQTNILAPAPPYPATPPLPAPARSAPLRSAPPRM